jgi:uncharacterized membrane protein
MMYVERTIEIDAPVEKVFQFVADFRNWPKFYEGVSEVEPTTEITRGTGARYAYKAKVLGMRVPVGTEIHDFVENEGWTGVSVKGVEHKTRWIFAWVNGRTRFTHGVWGRLPVPILGNVLATLFLEPEWRRIVEQSL